MINGRRSGGLTLIADSGSPFPLSFSFPLDAGVSERKQKSRGGGAGRFSGDLGRRTGGIDRPADDFFRLAVGFFIFVVAFNFVAANVKTEAEELRSEGGRAFLFNMTAFQRNIGDLRLWLFLRLIFKIFVGLSGFFVKAAALGADLSTFLVELSAFAVRLSAFIVKTSFGFAIQSGRAAGSSFVVAHLFSGFAILSFCAAVDLFAVNG